MPPWLTLKASKCRDGLIRLLPRTRFWDNFRVADQPPSKRYSGSACNNLCCFPMGRIDGEDLPRWHLSLLQRHAYSEQKQSIPIASPLL